MRRREPAPWKRTAAARARDSGADGGGGVGASFRCVVVDDGPYRWRLSSGNARVLGISAPSFDSADEAAAAARDVQATAALGIVELASTNGSAWRWTMSVDGVAVATSAAVYGRRHECLAAIGRFRATAATALVDPVPLVFRRARV
jgi:uncharacterized protein YegP (UPF0339 family)